MFVHKKNEMLTSYPFSNSSSPTSASPTSPFHPSFSSGGGSGVYSSSFYSSASCSTRSGLFEFSLTLPLTSLFRLVLTQMSSLYTAPQASHLPTWRSHCPSTPERFFSKTASFYTLPLQCSTPHPREFVLRVPPTDASTSPSGRPQWHHHPPSRLSL